MCSFFQQKSSFPTISPWTSTHNMNVRVIFLPLHSVASSYVHTPLAQPYIQCIFPHPLRISERSSKGTATLGLHLSLRLARQLANVSVYSQSHTHTQKGHFLTVRLKLQSWNLKENLTCEQNQPVYIKKSICFFNKPTFRNTLLPLSTNKKNPGVKLPFFPATFRNEE